MTNRKCAALGCGTNATGIPANQIGRGNPAPAEWQGKASSSTFVVCSKCRDKMLYFYTKKGVKVSTGITWTPLFSIFD